MNCSSVKWLTQQSHPAAETFNHLSNSSSEGGPYGDFVMQAAASRNDGEL